MKTPTVPKTTGASLYEPDQMVKLASHLQQTFKEQNLICPIQGRDYVKVSGWQYAGTKLGIVPMVEEVTDQSDDKRIQYQTRVALLNIKTNEYVGCGIALCSNLENGKKNQPAYAIQSLSQTRAIGKAYRNLLGWVVELAGFEATPVEEMDSVHIHEREQSPSVNDSGTNIGNVIAKRKELLLALNHECISQQERDQMFMCIDKMDAERCQEALGKVNHKINQYDLYNH